VTPYYNVRPRYTSGSPAIVDAQTAGRVAKQEKEAYEDALTGIFGIELKTRAEREGLGGIAERVMSARRQNRTDGFVVWDLITCTEYWRPQRRGGDVDAEPECLYEEDHQLDPTTIQFLTGDNNTVQIGARCKLCNRIGRSAPLGIEFGNQS